MYYHSLPVLYIMVCRCIISEFHGRTLTQNSFFGVTQSENINSHNNINLYLGNISSVVIKYGG